MGGGEKDAIMLLVRLLRCKFSGLWNVIGGLANVTGRAVVTSVGAANKQPLPVGTTLTLCGPWATERLQRRLSYLLRFEFGELPL